MPRRLLVLNAVLTIICVAFAVGIVRTLLAKQPLPAPAPPRAVAAPQPTATTGASDSGPEAFEVIAAQNLFNPLRSVTTSATAVPVAKPILHGIVIHGAQSRAFLEDPTVKRVTGYSVGDTVGGGKIQKIADDRVVIAHPEGLMEVLLKDPSKPRPAPIATAASPGTAAPRPVAPSQAAPPGAGAPGQLASSQVAPGQVVSPTVGPPPAPQLPSTVPQFRGRPAPQGPPADDQ